MDPEKGEIKELVEAYKLGFREAISEELADCFILLCTLAWLSDISLESAVLEKMMKNVLRHWGSADEKGIVTHLP